MTENFGTRLRLLRTKHNLTLDELAEKSGIHASTIKTIERRGARPPLPTAKKFAQALEIPTGLLLKGDCKA